MKVLEVNSSNLVLLEIFLVCACVLGDYLLQVIPVTNSPKTSSNATEYNKSDNNWKLNLWTRAFIDSVTHGLVGMFSWAIVINFSFKGKEVFQLLLSFIVAVSIDFDHFLAAKSIHIEDALNLSQRPPFHSSTLILIVTVTVWIIGYIPQIYYSKILSLLILSSGMSHHIRDGTRRGLWFPPVGSTPPIPHILYIIMITLLPVCIRFIYISLNIVPIK